MDRFIQRQTCQHEHPRRNLNLLCATAVKKKLIITPATKMPSEEFMRAFWRAHELSKQIHRLMKLNRAGANTASTTVSQQDAVRRLQIGYGGGETSGAWLRSLPRGSTIQSVDVPGSDERAPAMMYAHRILKPETISAAAKLGPIADQILDRWAMGWKAKLKAMEKDGTLLPRLKEQAEAEKDALMRGREGGQNSHLSDAEIQEIYGPPTGL